MDCKSCHLKCKAQCCALTLIPKSIYERNVDKIVNPVVGLAYQSGPDILDNLEMDITVANTEFVLPMTENLKCCFLNTDLSCNIYDDRPNICKKFGDESHSFMTCHFQDKHGRIRSRQERRKLERANHVTSTDLLKILSNFHD